MRPRPYAIVAYSPASSTAETARSMKRATRLLRALRVGAGARAGGRVLREDDRRRAVLLVLLHDERVLHLVPELGLELGRAAGQERRHARRLELLPDRLAVHLAGLLDRREEHARRLVGERLEPLGLAAAILRLERGDEVPREAGLRGELRAPPHAREDVGGVLRPERLDRVLLRASRAVGNHLVTQAGRDVLPVHRDVVGQVRVDEEEVHARGLHLPEQGAEVLPVQLERLVHRDLIRAALPGEVRDALAEVLAVGGVLPQERDLRGLRELARALLLVDPLHEGRAEQLDGRDEAEEVLEAALVDLRRAAAAVHVGDLVLLGDGGLRLDEVARVRAEQEVDPVAVHQAVGEAHRRRLRGRVVEEDELHRQLLPADLEPALLVRLLEGEVVALLEEAADARLGTRERERRADEDLVLGGVGDRGDERRRGERGGRGERERHGTAGRAHGGSGTSGAAGAAVWKFIIMNYDRSRLTGGVGAVAVTGGFGSGRAPPLQRSDEAPGGPRAASPAGALGTTRLRKRAPSPRRSRRARRADRDPHGRGDRLVRGPGAGRARPRRPAAGGRRRTGRPRGAVGHPAAPDARGGDRQRAPRRRDGAAQPRRWRGGAA